MSKTLEKIACSNCRKLGNDTSGDNMQLYQEDDGRVSGYCFSCQTHVYDMNKDTETNSVSVDGLPFGTMKDRKVTVMTAEFYGVRRSFNSDGEVDEVYYPYGNSYKIRKVPKEFRVSNGLPQKFFGQDLPFASSRYLVITEGEEDTLAIAEANRSNYGKFYPVVSLASATNMKAVTQNIKWLQSFEHVVLWMDNDDAGEKAKQEIAKIVGYANCKIAGGPEKDASDTLVKHGHKAVLSAIWNAQPYNPQGILMGEKLWEHLEAYADIESVPYPPAFEQLNEKLMGMRMGEISLFTSGTGAGKSSMMREIVMHLLETTEERVGIISLEESPAETVRKLCAMRLGKNPSEHELPLSELRTPFEDLFKDNRVVVLDHQGAITESITAQLNYMAAIGCKYLFVDHITILVSEGSEGLTGNEATDKVMNDLLKVAKTYNVWIGLVSHLRKSDKVGKSFEQGNMPSLDDIRGSGSIKQISMDIIAFARNSEDGENNVNLKVLKCRHTGLTGHAGSLVYDRGTGRLEKSDGGFIFETIT